jgi:hypothetical protein
MLYQFDSTSELDFNTFINIFIYGLKMDMSFAGYLSFIPFLLLTISIFNTRIICTILKVYTYLCLFFTSLLFVLDLELFRVWGYKIDVSILKYLDSPTEVIASSLASPILLLVFLFLFQSILFLFIYNKLDGIHKEFFWKASAFLLLTAFLFIPIRGGFGLSPMNQSTVCFSNNNFANQAAINYAWNFFDTVVFEQDDANPYVFMENSAAESILTKLYSQENSSLSVLKNDLISYLLSGKALRISFLTKMELFRNLIV